MEWNNRKIKIHTSDFLRLDLDLVSDDGCWGLHPIRHPRMTVGFEMTWLVIVETHSTLLTITSITPFCSTVVAFELETGKPMDSPTHVVDVEVLMTSSTQVSYIECFTYRQQCWILCPPSLPLSHLHIKVSFSSRLNNFFHSLNDCNPIIELNNQPVSDPTNDPIQIF